MSVQKRQRPAKPTDKGHTRSKASKPSSKRPRAELNPSASGSGDEGDNRAAMLAALEAHGRALFGFAGPDEAETSEQGRRRLSGSSGGSSSNAHEAASGSDEDEDAELEGEGYESDDGWGEGDEMVTDSEDEGLEVPQQAAPVKPTVPEVVFAPSSASVSTAMTTSERRAFLKGNSAKMMGIKTEVEYGPKGTKRARGDEGDLEDQSNLKLDRTLHDMLLTTLLPTANADAAQRPVDKRNAISGRLLELAQYQLPGEGSKHASSANLSSHPAKIRTGLIHAQQKRDAKAKAEAEAAGSFVRGIGGLGGEGRGKKGDRGRGVRAGLGEDTGKKRGMDGRKDEKRDRGLAMGFGKYDGGMLKLSERDIARGSNEGSRGGRGRRGGRGGRGERGRGGGGGGRGGGKKRGGW